MAAAPNSSGDETVVFGTSGNDLNAYDTGTNVQTGSSSGAVVNGAVTNQAGDPVANATVQLTVSKKPSVPQADSQLDTLSNPIPSAYTNQL